MALLLCRLFYVCQRADRYALAAGACGVYLQLFQHFLMVDLLKLLTVELASVVPSGKGIHRAGIETEPA